MSNPWADSFDEYRQSIIGEGKGKKEPRWQDDDCDDKWYEKSDTDGKISKREKKEKAKHYKEDITLTRGDYGSRNVKGSAWHTAAKRGFKGYKAGGGLTPQFKLADDVQIDHIDGSKTEIVDVVKAPAMVAAPKLSNWKEEMEWQDEALKPEKLKIKEGGVKNKIEINPDVKTEGYASTKRKEVKKALKRDRPSLSSKERKKIASNVVKKKGDTSKSDDRYAYEEYDNTKSPDYKKKKKALAKKHGGKKNIKGHPQYEHHQKDANGNTIPHDLDEGIGSFVQKKLEQGFNAADKVSAAMDKNPVTKTIKSGLKALVSPSNPNNKGSNYTKQGKIANSYEPEGEMIEEKKKLSNCSPLIDRVSKWSKTMKKEEVISERDTIKYLKGGNLKNLAAPKGQNIKHGVTGVDYTLVQGGSSKKVDKASYEPEGEVVSEGPSDKSDARTKRDWKGPGAPGLDAHNERIRKHKERRGKKKVNEIFGKELSNYLGKSAKNVKAQPGQERFVKSMDDPQVVRGGKTVVKGGPTVSKWTQNNIKAMRGLNNSYEPQGEQLDENPFKNVKDTIVNSIKGIGVIKKAIDNPGTGLNPNTREALKLQKKLNNSYESEGEVIDERLGGKGYSKKATGGGGDWEDSDRGGGHKWQKRVGKPVKKKSPTYLAYVKNKKKTQVGEAKKKKDDTYLETDWEKRKENNEKARKDLQKGPQMKNPHLESANPNEIDIDWKVKNTLSSHKTDHKTGNFSVGKRWMSDQERVGKMNNMMTGVKMDADGLLPDVGGAVQKNVDKGIPIAAKFIDKGNAIANKALSDKLGQEVNIKNMDGETFKNMATNANKDTAFNINRNIPGTQAYRFQGVSDMINKNKSLKASYEPEAELVELNRYGKETGKATGSINKRPGSKVKKGGNTSDKALLAVRGMIRRETGKPEGQRKKTKGEKGRRQVGDRKFSPADTIAKRRQSKKDADAAMMDTRGT